MVKRIIFCMAMCLAWSGTRAQTMKHGFKEGYYFTKDGKKVSGFLRFNYGGGLLTSKSNGDCSVTFLESKGAKKRRFTTDDICCFVIAKDSFATIENFKLNLFANYPHDFAQVLETGVINLYLYRSIQGTLNRARTVEDWVIEKNSKVDKLNRKNFKKLLPEYLTDDPDLAEKINTKSTGFDYRNSRKIVALYNQYARDRDR